MTGGLLRARVLVPSLLAVTWVCACGGTAVSGGTAGASGDMHQSTSDDGDDDAAGGPMTKPPVVVDGGSNPSNPSSPGAVNLPTDCPKSLPVEGSKCGVPQTGINYCKYSASCGELIVATCSQSGVWSLPQDVCGGSGGAPALPPFACPSALPSDGTPCYRPGAIVSYNCLFQGPCGAIVSTCNGNWSSSALNDDCAGAGGAG